MTKRKETKRKEKKFVPAAWQTDPRNLDQSLEYVQCWAKDGGMMTARMKRGVAMELVEKGYAFIISGQAIERM